MRAYWHRSHVVCISLVALLAMLAMAVPAAQAGEFRVGGKTFAAAGVSSEAIKGEVGKTDFSVAWLGFAIACSGGKVDGEVFQKGPVYAQVVFEGCVVVGSEKTCVINDEGAGKIRIEDLGEILLHGEKLYAKFVSEEFTTLLIEGAFCTLPEEMIASGSAAMYVPSAKSEKVDQSFSAVTDKSEGALLKIGVQCAGEPAAILGGAGTIHLSGANSGKSWGFE